MDNYYGYKIVYDLVHETDKAYLVRDKRGEFWVPKSLTRNSTIRDNQIQFATWSKFRPEYLPEHDTIPDTDMVPLVKVLFVSEEPDFDTIDMKKLKRKKKKKKSKVLYDTEWARNEGLI